MRCLPLFATTLGLLAAVPSASQVPPTLPGARSLLWIGAHPDDELLAAPLLARLCVVERVACTFLVLTRGEAGTCALPGGCHPDLAAVRTREMRRSAQLFGATLQQWSYPDAEGGAEWDDGSGNPASVAERIAELIDATLPDVVLTFDPRHGSTCHRDHKATGEAVLAALELTSRHPAVYLLETRLATSSPPPRYAFSSAAPLATATLGFDANHRLGSSELTGWQFLLLGAKAHASQFNKLALRGLEKVPPRQRVVYLAPAALALASDAVWSCE